MGRSAATAAQLLAAGHIAEKCVDVAQVLRSLAHPVRLKILSRLVGGERSVNDLTLHCGVSQSAMSQFLKRMKVEGMLASRRDGQFMRYRIADAKLHRLMQAMSDIYC